MLVALLAGLGGLLWWSASREPSYRGEPLSVWLSRATEVGVYEQKNPRLIECREAVRSMGTRAIPRLLRILRARDSAVKRVVMDLMERQSYVRSPFQSVEEQRQQAATGFLLLGELGTNAIPELIEICRHPASPYSRAIADGILMQLYPARQASVPYWLPAQQRPEWYIEAGTTQSRAGLTSNAILAFSDAIRLQPTNSAAYVNRGGEKLQLQDILAARLDFEKAMELDSSNETAVFGRGICNFDLKNFKAAEADFSKAFELETNDLRTLNYRGLCKASSKDFSAALADFSKVLEVESNEPTAFRNRAMVEIAQTEYEKALEDISNALQLDSKDPLAWATRSRLQCVLKNYEAGMADANKAIQLEPKYGFAYTIRALIHTCKDEFPASATDLETALKLRFTNELVYVVRGALRAKRGGEDEAALADFEQAAELAPQTPETHGTLGVFQYRFGKWEPALANCRKAMEMRATTSISTYNAYIWLIQAQTGQVDAANKELQAYLASLDKSKSNEWSTITARFFTGVVSESNLLSLASTAAKRPSAVTNQICESFYYAGMKRKLAGDKQGARQMFQRSVDTRDDNCMAYMNAGVELTNSAPINSE